MRRRNLLTSLIVSSAVLGTSSISAQELRTATATLFDADSTGPAKVVEQQGGQKVDLYNSKGQLLAVLSKVSTETTSEGFQLDLYASKYYRGTVEWTGQVPSIVSISLEGAAEKGNPYPQSFLDRAKTREKNGDIEGARADLKAAKKYFLKQEQNAKSGSRQAESELNKMP